MNLILLYLKSIVINMLSEYKSYIIFNRDNMMLFKKSYYNFRPKGFQFRYISNFNNNVKFISKSYIYFNVK